MGRGGGGGSSVCCYVMVIEVFQIKELKIHVIQDRSILLKKSYT